MIKRNHVKLLTREQLQFLKDRYYFEYDPENHAVITCNARCARRTSHPLHTKFKMYTKVKLVTITVDAMRIWLELDQKYNLFEVQQAVYMLNMMFQDINAESVKRELEKGIING